MKKKNSKVFVIFTAKYYDLQILCFKRKKRKKKKDTNELKIILLQHNYMQDRQYARETLRTTQ